MRTTPLNQLRMAYADALRDYLDGAGEAALLRAYQVGREAVGLKVGVLELAAVHQEALVSVLLRMLTADENARIARQASEFFVESVAPLEMTQRGTQEANVVLGNLNQELEARVEERTAELERAFRELSTTREKVTEHERIERLKDEFVALVGHEIRTPMTSIHGGLGLVRSGAAGSLPPEARDLVEIAFRNSQHLVRLVDGLLDLQKIEAGEMTFRKEPLDLAALVAEAVASSETYAQRFGVSYEVLFETRSEARVISDPDRLLQVLTNLLGNAAKFSPPGERVRVRVSRSAGGWRVDVIDRGPGIPEAFRDRIFQRFAQAEGPNVRPRGGTGLGLHIARAIVEGLGGTIGFETRNVDGTTFFFELPEAPVTIRPEPREADTWASRS